MAGVTTGMRELVAEAVRREEAAYERVKRRRPLDGLQQREAARLWGRLQLARELLAAAAASEVAIPEVFASAWDSDA
jgi:hypothetical protein